MTTPQGPSSGSNINQQLDALDRQTAEALAETRKLIEKRDKLNEQFKKLRQESRELKAERDIINEKVRALKAQRDETRATIHTIIEEIKKVREKIFELRKKTPKRSQSDLQKEFDDIEWKIQTTSLDLKEEKMLIEEVKQLELQLNAYKKIEHQAKKISEMEQGLKALDKAGEKTRSEISALAQKSQELHEKMLGKIDEAKKIKEEADSIHNAYLLTREKARLFDEQRRRLTGELRRQRESERQFIESQRQAQETQRQQENASRTTTEKALKEKLEAQAREKLQRGEKLSWDEFQLLADEDESDTQD